MNNELTSAFREFHARSPQVFVGLKSLALIAKKRGATRYGIKALIEVYRWNVLAKTDDPEFKINNNHAPFYARLLMREVPELDGFFETRMQTEGFFDGESNGF